ncbi:MAG: hypothetical protein QM719_11565 [Thermomonas sp.]
MHDATDWQYEETVGANRRSHLTEPTSFEELVTLATADICHIKLRIDHGRGQDLTDCLRPVFSFELPTVGDRIFNGSHGYRAQYWLSPMNGLQANASLIGALTSHLLAVVDPSDPDFSKINVCVSLKATSAKFWIQEIPSLLVNPSVDLRVEPWRSEAQRGVQLARWGLSAPEVTRFDIMGALLDPSGNEVVPSRKICRHYDIHHYGFS